jgi:hypothetical protein
VEAIVRVHDRHGLVYQRVDGPSMWEVLYRRPWRLFRSARRAAELHAELHARTIPADLTRSSILVLGAAASSQIRTPLRKATTRLFHAAYLHHYFRLRPGSAAEYRRWLPVVAAARLSERIPALENWLIAQVERPV